MIPSPKIFLDALHQACAAEQQEKQLSSLHRSGSATKLNSNAKPMASARTQKTSVTFQSEKYSRILYTRRVKCPAYAMSAVDLVTIGVTAQNASHLARLQEGTEQDNEQPVQQSQPPLHTRHWKIVAKD